ncbi:MAG: penicillin-binding protein 2 [Bacteroidetes bacterium]|nr:MAG: penicillin-binding protein 2 [Bacteroidota bacterium]MBL1143879.1 penicillin-binding protein 2 [Bacteroidota bacterium]MCB0801511.1 penicillin-binding protein 2 [Flavobacteriales bacterium]NOG56680.1 penicillin-binding protein 2 [Bacteroidota bacterium]
MKHLESRKYIIGIIFLSVGIIFSIRLFYVQVIDNHYKSDANNNVLRHVVKYPARGLVYDRNGELLVFNEAAYDLMVTPKQVKEDFDTLAFCSLIEIDKAQFIEKLNKAKQYSYYKSSIFEKEISSKSYAKIQEQLFNYPGFFVQTRTLRSYPQKTAAHLLGYVGEANQKMIAENAYYKSGDHIGISGIEKQYETELRGKRGLKIVMVDVFNREKGSFMNGIYDTTAISGSSIQLSISAKLQRYGEELMQNKKGSIVAIDPKTGEVLALVTMPTYDPNLLVGRARSKNYNLLSKDTLNPLFNRALMAKYPPGSTFKSINALIGLQLKTLSPNTLYSCNRGFSFGGRKMGCHAHSSPVNLEYSIQTSCNAYYCNVFKNIIDKFPTAEQGYLTWRNYVMSFGLGKKTGLDLPNELSGFVPNTDYYDRYYQKGRWSSSTILSLAIGQGELGFTPMQMANMVATIANRGYYLTPHVAKMIDNQPIQKLDSFVLKHETGIEEKYFDEVVEAMFQVVQKGTGTSAKIDSIQVCGKTGTVQNPHGQDHSTFIAFAPKDDPKIAISVYVENGYWGSRWAAPIAGLMIEKYLRDTITRPLIEKRMLEGNLIGKVQKPIGNAGE